MSSSSSTIDDSSAHSTLIDPPLPTPILCFTSPVATSPKACTYVPGSISTSEPSPAVVLSVSHTLTLFPDGKSRLSAGLSVPLLRFCPSHLFAPPLQHHPASMCERAQRRDAVGPMPDGLSEAGWRIATAHLLLGAACRFTCVGLGF